MESSGQIKSTLVNAVYGLIIIAIMSQSTITRWQMFAMVLLTVRVTTEIWQHWVNSSPILNSRRVEAKLLDGHSKQLSVVVPSYNPGLAILHTLDTLNNVLSSSGIRYEVIVVSDGSTDASPEWLDQYSQVDLHVKLRTNHGKGAALREGFAVASGDVICFIDADGDIDPAVLTSMYELISSDEFDVVYGSKLHPSSEIKMDSFRFGLSRLFRIVVKILFRINVTDTQSGVKAYRGDLIRSALPLMKESGFNLDLEIFVLSKHLGYLRFAEHPISLNRAGESSIKPSTLLSMFWSTVSMYWRVHLTLEYNELIERTQE
jgi:glycosyltransferase involved in cell wall biosynthesis